VRKFDLGADPEAVRAALELAEAAPGG